MQDVPRLAALLVAQDPRQAADTIVTYLSERHRARGGAVLALRDGAMVPFVGSLTTAELLEAEQVWIQHERTGRDVVIVRRHVLARLVDEGRMVGLFVLLEPADVDPSGWSIYWVALAKALASKPLVSSQGGALIEDPRAVERESLVNLLHREEWNVARVARLLRVTRRTIYARMERMGIVRERVPKTLRRES